MSGGALFSNNAVRGASKNLVEFKAGKMTMKGKMVYPDTRKGLLYVYQSDDSLMHLCWKDRTSGVIEDDLIIFPDDCEFKHVSQCKTGRVYLLRFKLSSKKFFFWLQDLKTEKDEEHCRKINEVLNNPPTPGSQRSGGPNAEGDLQNILNNMSQQQLIQLFGGVGQIGLGSLLGTMRDRPHNTRASTTTSSSPVTTSATRPPAAQTPAPTSVTETLGRSSSGTPKNSGSKPANATNLMDRSQTLISDPHLFDLQRHLWNISTPPGAEPIVQSGQAGPVVRQFGLGSDAVNAAATGNLEEFVSALETDTKTTDDAGGQAAAAAVAAAATVQGADDDKTASKKEAADRTVGEKKEDKDDEMALD